MPKKASTKNAAAKSGSNSKTVAKKVTKSKKTTKTVAKTEPVEVVTKEVVADDKSVSSTASQPGSELAEQFSNFMAKLQQVCAAMSSLKSEFRSYLVFSKRINSTCYAKTTNHVNKSI